MTKRRINRDENNPINISKIKIIKSQYQCVKCGWTFNRLFNARRHYDRFHLPLKRLIICKTCGEVFSLKWNYHVHQRRVHKMPMKTYGRNTPLRRKITASPTKKYQLVFKHNVPTVQPIEHIINSFHRGKKCFLYRWNEENQQKTLSNRENQKEPIENICDINNTMKNHKLSTSNVPFSVAIYQQDTQQLLEYTVTSANNLMEILSSKMDF